MHDDDDELDEREPDITDCPLCGGPILTLGDEQLLHRCGPMLPVKKGP